MQSCIHKHRADILVCRHCADGGEAIAVLVADDDGQVDWALCRICACVEQPFALPCVSMCTACAGEQGIPTEMPAAGRWQVGEHQVSIH